MIRPLLTSLCVLPLAFGACTPGPDDRRPNVVLIVVDTLRADHLSLYGYPRPTSPNLDRLARESVVFDRAFTVMSHTLPAHVSLVTGVHPATHQVLSNGWVYDARWPTLATRLRDAGYASAAFVSGFPLDRQSGFGHGFEVFADTRIEGVLHSKVEGELTNQRALAWLKEQGDWPFFLLVHYYDLHTPYTWPSEGALPLAVDADLLARLEQREAASHAVTDVNHKPVEFRGRQLEIVEAANLYDNLVLRIDGLVEEIRAELERAGKLDDTLFIVTSDHGEGLGQHAYYSHGLHLYEEQMRIPLIVRPPARLGWAPGREGGTVSLLDVAPTVVELAGLPREGLEHGRSLLAVTQEVNGARYVVAQRRYYPEGFRNAWGAFAPSTSLAALRGDGSLKYIRDGDGREELYDLSSDPLEEKNLASERVEDATRLREILEERLAVLTADTPIAVPELDAETRRRLEELGYIQ
jgi:arylsulfatase A-like enzyme